MREPTMTRALPVSQNGIEAKIGKKNTEMKNMRSVFYFHELRHLQVESYKDVPLVPVALST